MADDPPQRSVARTVERMRLVWGQGGRVSRLGALRLALAALRHRTVKTTRLTSDTTVTEVD